MTDGQLSKLSFSVLIHIDFSFMSASVFLLLCAW